MSDLKVITVFSTPFPR